MKKKFVTKELCRNPILMIAVLLTIVLLSTDALAVASKFRMQFVYNRRANQFRAQEFLVKGNKDIIPAEIQGFVDDALSYNKTFEERMYLLDNAHALANMYSIEFSDDTALKEIRAIQAMELVKQEARKERLLNLASYEGLRGNFIMNQHGFMMEAEGQKPVIYPHWIHQLYFKCTVCHDSKFKMKRETNDISHAKFAGGGQCGACHDGTVAFSAAFSAKENCTRCHVTNPPGEAFSTEKLDSGEIKETAERLEVVWDQNKLEDGKLPFDKFGNIDWKKAETLGIIAPKATIEGQSAPQLRDNLIVFIARAEGVLDVPFSHKIHSEQMNCSSCHPKIFPEKLGGSKVTMAELALGKYCAACHGKTSFPLLDCQKCHNLNKADIPTDALVRE